MYTPVAVQSLYIVHCDVILYRFFHDPQYESYIEFYKDYNYEILIYLTMYKASRGYFVRNILIRKVLLENSEYFDIIQDSYLVNNHSSNIDEKQS